jgi:serine/threonine-protein kinase HipA
MRLEVRQFGEVVGWLDSTADKGVIFQYDHAYARRPEARALSFSLPLRETPFPQSQALPFFAGLLPDGDLRRRIADRLHISEHSTIRLLEALGGECAGTVSLLLVEPEAKTNEAPAEEYEEISEERLAAMVHDRERLPLLISGGGARLSLAGAQEKIPLFKQNDRWYRPLGSAPSSHILKPASSTFPDIVTNEFICLKLAQAFGLPVPEAEIVNVGVPVLVIERFDRVRKEGGSVARLHQEDFCQALGIMPDRKYQADGGPGFADLARVLRRAGTAPIHDIELLIGIALFNLLIGNCDAHGKNFSLLYRGNSIGLSPFYDLVSTTQWPELDTKLSMRFGKEYKLEKITHSDLAIFADDLGVKATAVTGRLESLLTAASDAWELVFSLKNLEPDHDLIKRMRDGWEKRAARILTKKEPIPD